MNKDIGHIIFENLFIGLFCSILSPKTLYNTFKYMSIKEVLFMEIIDYIIPFSLTLLFSIIIGFERQYSGKSAGIYSHAFIALATCAIALLQKELALAAIESAKDNPMASIDINNQRIIAQVITGIGFLGAGVIMKDQNHITGLTTATTIFVCAMFGLIFGSGFYLLGSLLAIIITIFLYLRFFIRNIKNKKKHE